VGFVVLFSVFGTFVLFLPNALGEPDNFIISNPMSTPAHIVPEWYFLFAYAILRSVPNKLGGVVSLFCSILFLLSLPFTFKQTVKGNTFNPFSKYLYWFFILTFLLLTIGGGWPVEEPYTITSRFFSLCYFSFFLLNLPLRLGVEKTLWQ